MAFPKSFEEWLERTDSALSEESAGLCACCLTDRPALSPRGECESCLRQYFGFEQGQYFAIQAAGIHIYEALQPFLKWEDGDPLTTLRELGERTIA